MEAGNNVDYGRLRELVREALPNQGQSARRISLLATNGTNPDLLRNLLDGTNPQFPAVVGLCKALAINLSDIIGGLPMRDESPTKEWLTVVGEVEAGIFRASPEWGEGDWYQVEVDADPGSSRHSALVVRGRSMDRIFPPGTILRCEKLIGSSLRLRHDDYVIVERMRDGLSEVTCKRLNQRDDGNYELIAESWLPEYREPIFIGKPIETPGGPGFDALTENEIRVKAIVLDAYPLLPRRRTRAIPN